MMNGRSWRVRLSVRPSEYRYHTLDEGASAVTLRYLFNVKLKRNQYVMLIEFLSNGSVL